MRNRERIAWILSLVLLALVAFRLSPTLANRDDDYQWVRTLVDIHRQVASNYVEAVDEQKIQQAAIDGIMEELDPFSAYIPPAKQEAFDRALESTFRGVGIQLNQLPTGEIEVVTPIEGSPAHQAGVMAGDIILKVNGEAIQGLRLPEVVKKISGEVGTKVTLTVKHPTGEQADLTMVRQEIVVPTLKGYQRKPNNDWDFFLSQNPKVGYLRLTQFTPSTFDAVKPVIEQLLREGMEGLILDLRFNPGGQLDQAVKLVDLFIEDGVIVKTKGRARPENVKRATNDGTLPKFPMIVLVNGHSASASEIVAGSLADNNRAVVVGSRTYGKGSVQELINLDGKNGELKLTVAYYYLPSGRLVHKKKDAKDWGVEPHIVVPMTEEQEKALLRELAESERFRRPGTNPATVPTTQPVDIQLHKAVDTMIAAIIFHKNQKGAVEVDAPAAGGPTSRPSVD